jgi:hypothetical protein
MMNVWWLTALHTGAELPARAAGAQLVAAPLVALAEDPLLEDPSLEALLLAELPLELLVPL